MANCNLFCYREYIQNYIERIPLETEQKAHKVIRICEQREMHDQGNQDSLSLISLTEILNMAYFHCRIRIWTRTRIPILYKYYEKGIQIWIRVRGNMCYIILRTHRDWNLSPKSESKSESDSGNKPLVITEVVVSTSEWTNCSKASFTQTVNVTVLIFLTGTLTYRMGVQPNLPIKLSIDTMLRSVHT